MPRSGLSLPTFALAFGYALTCAGGLRADNDPAVQRGILYLRGRASSQPVGESALIALALLKAEFPATDPTVAACVAKIRARITPSGYKAEKQNGHDIYEAAVVIMALANLDAEAHRPEIQVVADYLIGLQKPNGSWDYTFRTNGDSSITQYAVLGLWEAENSGVKVPARVWDGAAGWYMANQRASGAWTYHPDDDSGHETVSMAAAAVGSLLICKRQLSHYSEKGEAPSALLVPLVPEGETGRYSASSTKAKIDSSVKGGMAWIGSHLTPLDGPAMGQSAYYGLYGIERLGALAEKDTLGRTNWYAQGRQFILSTQQAAGNWHYALLGDEMNTVWALLFLTRSTAKSIRRVEIKRLGAGTLLGGRGLPKDLSSMTVAGGRVVSRPMNGAVEKMLAVLEDPRAVDSADSALAGLVERYNIEGPGVLRPLKDRFRKMLTDRDPGLRRVAAWALGRTGDLDAVPDLIGAVVDPDEGVVDRGP